MVKALALVAFVLLLAGCNQDRIKQLETENQSLKNQLKASNLDFQEKCSAAAKRYIDSDWNRLDRDTILFDFHSHYNQSQNRCYVAIEWHYNIGRGPSWTNLMMVYDPIERVEYADFGETHSIAAGVKPEDTVNTCNVQGVQCDSATKWSQSVSPLMSK